MKSSLNPILSTISKSKPFLRLCCRISLHATGCSAQWLSIALADLPVLTQMALNIGTIVATLESANRSALRTLLPSRTSRRWPVKI
jgi:uncharacterized integral membrane protein